MAKVLLHHPKIRAQIRRNRKQADILIKQSGWVEGPLPPKAEPAAVTPAKKTASSSTSTSGEGK